MNKRDLILLKMMLDDINKINRKLIKFSINSFVKLKVARNIISHAYESVNLNIIWELIENYLPVLGRDISREIEEP
ncbi:MAG: DUF86 domain-containing protein [Clostridiales bacterium]|nr:DUF86 domain-containing protein [Clostridiales bacterium]